jgi:hypothetical protein
VRWTTDRPAGLLALVLLTACSQAPSPSPSPSPSAVPSSSAAPSSAAAEPGQPYAAAEILEAMRTSPRPDGVPDELETDAIADAVADAIWTFDGEPWDTILIGGSCGEAECLLEVSGARDGVDGDDLWTFTVDPAQGAVSLEGTELRAIPPEVVADLDRLARSLLDEADVAGMSLTTAAWEPPPDGDRYRMSYRSGGEEGSCGLDVVLGARQREIVDQRAVGDC